MAQVKSPLNDMILHEWDVARRTAEFFDEQLGRLRGIGITASVAVWGIAAQYVPILGGLLLPLNVSFLLMDKRFQKYLVAVSTYAWEIEEKYAFAKSGLTHSIREKSWISLRWIFYVLYSTFIIAAIYYLVPLVQQFLSIVFRPSMDP